MRETVRTDKAPVAIGPYSQAIKVKCSDMVFCSGQIPLDPKEGSIVGETAEVQCKQAMANLSAVLQAAGTDMSRVVKTTLYLSDMNDFAAVNQVYATFFPADPPARAAVEVARLPKDVKIQIEAIAAI